MNAIIHAEILRRLADADFSEPNRSIAAHLGVPHRRKTNAHMEQRSSRSRSNVAECGRGFTLVELLVTITILGILAGMVSGALIVARQSFRISATRATIDKLHRIIMTRYECYCARRVPLSDDWPDDPTLQFPENLSEMARIARDRLGWTPVDPNKPKDSWTSWWANFVRLAALRDMMRMEMPERWTDVTNGPLYLLRLDRRPPPAQSQLVPNPPSIYLAYRARCVAQNGNLIPSPENAPAECLYLFVTMLGGEKARRQFRGNEIGDTDGDGFPEFLDGWGRPIYFLRWAPGFNDSDLQRNVISMKQLDDGLTWTAAEVLTERQTAAQEDHDPFDPRRVDMAVTPSINDPPRGWRLFPLVYSAGADGEYGLSIDDQAAPYVWSELPLTNSHYARGWGLPLKVNGAWVHFDNIHNHRSEAEEE